MQDRIAALASFADINDEQNIVIQLDQGHLIVHINKEAERFLECKAHDVCGKCFFTEAELKGWDLPFLNHRSDVITNSELLFWRTVSLDRGYMIIGHQNHDPQSHSFSKLYFEKIIATVPHYIFWKDQNSHYIGCNENFARFVGLKSPHEIHNQTDYDFFDDEVADRLVREDAKVLNGVAILDKEAQYPDRTQSYRISKVPLRNHKQEIIGIIGIYTDVSSRKKIEQQLLEAKEKAEEANRAKTEFIANISHDLRTSLNVIMGMSKLLRIRRHYLEQEELIDGVVEAAHSLMHQIDEILDYSKIEEGKVSITKIPFDLLELIEEVVSLHAFEASLKNIKFIVDYPPTIPSYLESDPTAIKRLLGNLVGNATKFCESGHIKVSVSCVHQSLNDAVLKLRVQDTGIGIEQDKIDSVFERFSRVEPSYKGRFKGTGLGLSIVSWLVQRLGGEVGCESQLGVGTTFTVTMPFKIKMTKTPYRRPVPIDFPRTLVIDDYTERAQVIRELLAPVNGLCVNSLEACDVLMCAVKEKDPFQIVILDDMTQLVTTAELIGQMRSLTLLRNNKLIFMIRPNFEMKKEQGVVHYGYDKITKPIKPSNFLFTIYDLWVQSKKRAENVHNDDEQGIRVLLVEDELLAQKYCTIMFENLDYTLDIASNGQEAMALINEHDYALILMDVGLPDISGIDLTRQIRQVDRFNTIPIVALTAHVDNAKKQDCLAAGMSHFMNKPVSPDDLSMLLSHLFCDKVAQ